MYGFLWFTHKFLRSAIYHSWNWPNWHFNLCFIFWRSSDIMWGIWCLTIPSKTLIIFLASNKLTVRTVNIAQSCSWQWKKLLKHREVAFGTTAGAMLFQDAKYKTAEVWNIIRLRGTRQRWNKLIWGSYVSPKHSFISWLAIQNKLLTKDRLRSWGCDVEEICVLCGAACETRDHLFFTCFFKEFVANDF